MTTIDVTDFAGTDDPNLTVLDDVDLSSTAVLEDLLVRFRVDVDSQATWAMRKARAAAMRIAEVDQIAAGEVDRIQEWALRERKAPERELNFFSGLLSDYALRVRAENPKRKSVVTPYGTVQTRKTEPAVVLDDELAFLAWARDHAPLLVDIVEKAVSVVEIRKKVQATDDGLVITPGGQVVDGLAVKPGAVTATVTPDVTQ